MRKRLLTLDELITFCEQQNFTRFSSAETGYQLAVQVPATFKKDEDDEDPTMLYGHIKLLHTSRNLNGSSLTEKAAKKAMKRLAYKPLLANFTDVNDEIDFTSHDMEIDDDGNVVYIEKQIGCFTSDRPYLEQDPDDEAKKYLYAQVAVPREYTAAAEIIERKGSVSVSAELMIYEMSYDSKEKVLVLDDVEIMGATCLGVDPQTGEPVNPGMAGAELRLTDFSQENNSALSHFNADEKLIETLEKLNETLSNFNINENNQKGGLKMTKFQELLEKYNKTKEDIDFDYSEMSDEELEAKFAEEFFDGDDPGTGGETGGQETGGQETVTPQPGAQDPVVEEPEVPEPTEEDQTAATAVATSIGALTDDSTELEVAAVRDAYDALTDIQKGLVSAEVLAVLTAQETRITEEKNLKIDDSETPESKKIADEFVATPESYAVVMTDGTVREFAVSLQDQISALTMLVNETYGEADNCWYDVIVYDKNVVMSDWWSGKAYRQDYKIRSGIYSLVGDRVPVHSVFVTDDEEKALEELKANFASISAELDKYHNAEETARKQELMSSNEYKAIFSKEEYKDIDIDKFSLVELSVHLDEILLKYAKEGSLNFSSVNTSTETKKEEKKIFGQPSKKSKKGRYGSIFKK